MPSHRATLVALVVLLGAVVGLQALQASGSRCGLPAGVDRATCSTCGRPSVKRAALSYDALLADVYWIRAVQHYGSTKLSTDARQAVRPALSAARSDDVARSALQHRVSVRRDLPGRAVSGGRRPARPGDRAAAEGASSAARQVGVRAGHRLRLLLVAARLRAGRASGSSAPARCPARRTGCRPLAAVTLAEGGNRAARACCGPRSLNDADADWLQDQARFRLSQLDAMDQIDALRRRWCRLYRARTGSLPRSWDDLDRAGFLRGIPARSRRASVPARSVDRAR